MGRELADEHYGMCRLSTIEGRLGQGKAGKCGGKITFLQFLEMFRAACWDFTRI